MQSDGSIGRDLSLGFKPSRKSGGTFSEELDRSEAIAGGGTTSKGPLDRLFAILKNYLERH